MAHQVHVEGYDEFQKVAAEYSGKSVFALFSGSEVDGKSWCPDCVAADPIIKDCLKYAATDSVFIHCGVGGRDFWKDQTNVFRTDAKLKLKSVPTLMKLGKPNRLEEAQCAQKDLVQMMFEDD